MTDELRCENQATEQQDYGEMMQSLETRSGQIFTMRSALVALGLFLFFVCPRVSAQELKKVLLGYWPAANERMELIVDEDWSDEAGVRMIPFRLRYASGKPGTQDQNFQLLTFNKNEYLALQRLDSQVVTIPAGKAAVDGRVLMPQYKHHGIFEYELIQPGANSGRPVRIDRNDYFGRTTSPQTPASRESVWSRATLMLHSELPDFDERLQESESLAQQGPIRTSRSQMIGGEVDWEKLPILPSKVDSDKFGNRRVAVVNSFLDWERLKKLHRREADDSWLSYSCFQQMLMTVEDARILQADEPERWQAIRDWLATGGTLFLLDSGEQFEQRDRVDALFGFAGTANTVVDRWVAVNAAAGRQIVFKDAADADETKDWHVDFLLHPYGLGVVALSEGSSRGGAWGKYSVFACNNYHGLEDRAGFVLEGFDQPDLLRIPGVGDPPVNAFRILITLFFAIVGPLNYFLLRSQRRLHLMLFTLPAFALLACVGLLLYSLFADGIKTRGRIISYSQIDQRSKQLVSYSRQAYYSPLSAEDKLVYSMDTAVFPVVTDHESRPFLTRIRGGVQTLSGGNIQARVENQYLAIRACSNEAGLEFIAGDTMQFRNLLGGKIQCVIIRDHQGNFFLTDQIAAGEIGAASPCSLPAAANQLELYLKDVREELNLGYPATQQANDPSPENVIWKSLRQDVSQLEHNSYLAIVDSSSEIPVLQPKARFESSLNMIRGSW